MNKTIHVLDVKITNKCNYCCEYCYAESDNPIDITQEVYSKALELAKAIGAIHIEFCGGEPLVHPNFAEFAKKAKQKGFKLILRTNGFLLEKNIKAVAENFEWVGVSLDGMKESNNIMRKCWDNKVSGEEKFNKPIDAMIELKKENPKIKLLLGTMLSSINKDELGKLAEFIKVKKLPLDSWKIYRFMSRRQRSLINKDKFFISSEDFSSTCKKIDSKEIEKTQGIKVLMDDGLTKSGNCLILSPDGTLSISSLKLFNIMDYSVQELKDKLFSLREIDDVINNKKTTYY